MIEHHRAHKEHLGPQFSGSSINNTSSLSYRLWLTPPHTCCCPWQLSHDTDTFNTLGFLLHLRLHLLQWPLIASLGWFCPCHMISDSAVLCDPFMPSNQLTLMRFSLPAWGTALALSGPQLLHADPEDILHRRFWLNDTWLFFNHNGYSAPTDHNHHLN